MKTLFWAASLGLAAAMAGAAPVAAAPYEYTYILTCGGTSCAATGPMVPFGKTVTIAALSCDIAGSSAGRVAVGELTEISSNSVRQFFAANVISGNHTVAPYGPVVKRYVYNQFPLVRLTFPNSDNRQGECAVRGTITP